ncbi:MAG: hypothetical protein QOJ59_2728 [Thermomicrobiales bacterium]|nr:hypothetical protein [Thermomicrobiales bacterium]MEA2526127.1 hypothetical protein [Thermomicrobiales bacterium]
MSTTGRRANGHVRARWLVIVALLGFLPIVPTTASTVAAQPATPPTIRGTLVPAELPAMMLTPADLEAAGLPGAGVGGGQTVTSLADALASQTYAASRGLLRLSTEPDSERILTDAGWQRFHERRLGTSSAENPSFFAVEADSGLERFATAQGAADAFAFYTDPQVALRMSPIENLPVDNPPAIGEEAALWQLRGRTSDTREVYRGLSLWFRTDNFIASVAVLDYEGAELPSQQLVEALGERLLARIEEVQRHGGPGLGDRILRLGGETVTIAQDHYRIMDDEVLPLLGGTAQGLAERVQLRDRYDVTDDYYVFSEVASGGSGSSDNRTFSVLLIRFADATGAGGYLAGFPDRLRDSDFEEIAFPSDAPALGDESLAATYSAVGRQYVDVLTRVDRQVFRLRIGSPELMDWSTVETLATEQIACLQDGACLDAIDPPAELLASVPRTS